MPVVTLNVVGTVASTMASTPSTPSASHHTLIDDPVLDTGDYLSCGAEDKEGEFILDNIDTAYTLITDLEVILDVASLCTPNDAAILVELRFNGAVIASYRGGACTGGTSNYVEMAVSVSGLSILVSAWNAGTKTLYWKSLDGGPGYPDFFDPA